MVILKKITIKNFLSHKDTEVSFNENTKLSIEGPSGSGKSSIVEAIIWTLYGKGRVENRNIIKRGAKFATVVLEVIDGKKSYRIERNVNLTGKHTLDISEKKAKAYVPLKKIGLKDSQSWIEKELLKSSYTLFINSVAYPQDNIESFVKQTAGKRKELLLEIADTDNYDELYDKAKNKLDEMRDGMVRAQMLLDSFDDRIKDKESLSKEIPTLMSAIEKTADVIKRSKLVSEEEEKRVKYLNEIETQIEKNSFRMSTLLTNITMAKGSIDSKQSRLSEIGEVSPEEVKTKKELLIASKESLEGLRNAVRGDYEADLRRKAIIGGKRPTNDFTASLARLEEELLEIYTINNPFCEHIGKDCPKLINVIKNRTESTENQITDIKERMAKQKADEDAYQKELSEIPLQVLKQEDYDKIAELELLIKELSVYENYDSSQIDFLNGEILNLAVSIDSYTEEMMGLDKDNESLKKEIESSPKSNLVELRDVIDEHTDELAKMKATLTIAIEAEEDIKRMKKEKEELLSGNKKAIVEKECLELAKDAFGAKGIKTVVVDYLIPRLEYRINEILSKMSDFKIRLETQKGKFDGDGVTEGLFINIYNSSSECFDYGNYSGGEKMKITIAIAEALATLQKCSFRIFDEVFTALDESSLENFNEVIHSLQDRFSQILCISHIRLIKDSFEDKLLVALEEGTSKICQIK